MRESLSEEERELRSSVAEDEAMHMAVDLEISEDEIEAPEPPPILSVEAFSTNPEEVQVGLYADVPEAEYHKLDAASNSRLKALHRSPAHAREAIDNPSDSTPAQIVGTCAHWAILEPEIYKERVDVAGQCSAKTNKGSQCSYGGKVRLGGHWFCNRHAPDGAEPDDVFVISEDDRDQIKAMAEAVEEHATAAALVAMEGHCELTAVFEHETPRGMLLCKARLDYWGSWHKTLVDLKTTTDASKEQFKRSLWNFGYFRQLAFYRYALEQLGREVDEALIIAVEKTPPYAPVVYEVTEQTLAAGWRQLEDLLDRYAECVATDEWPGYGDEVQEIALPQWAVKKL